MKQGRAGHTGSGLDEERLDLVAQQIVASGARSVLDLGCGTGKLMLRLAGEHQINRIVGLDPCGHSLSLARRHLGIAGWLQSSMLSHVVERVSVIEASLLVPDERLAGFDAAALVEVIEHLDPGQLPALERSVFRCSRPRIVIVTTPNREYNHLYPMGQRRFRHPGHRFEWDRAEFRAWAEGIARRNGYRVGFRGIGDEHPHLGTPTQMATFAALPGSEGWRRDGSRIEAVPSR